MRRLIPQLMALQTTATATLRKADIPCHCLNLVIYYHPQRSCEGYVFTGVCLSTGGGWYPSMPCRWYPSMPFNRSPGGGVLFQHALQVVSQHALQQVSGGCLVWGSAPSWCLVWGDVCSQGVCSWGGVPGLRGSARGGAGIPACTEANTPGETTAGADGTHPTGMHSCFLCKFIEMYDCESARLVLRDVEFF